MYRLAEVLHERRYPSLRLRCEFFAGKTHLTAHTEAVHRGLELCWGGQPYELTTARADALQRDLWSPTS
jgi:hypothetical protein